MNILLLVYIISWVILGAVYLSSKFGKKNSKDNDPWYLYAVMIVFAPLVALLIPYILYTSYRDKKKGEANSVLVEMADKVRDQAFPGGNEQLIALINQQYEELGHRYSKDVISKVVNYIGVGIIVFNDKSAHRIAEVGLRPQKLVSDEDALHLYKAVVRNMFEHKFGKNEAGFKSFYQSLGNIEGAKVGDVMPGAYGEYGTDTSNPIPINGVHNSYTYLGRLRLPNGEKIKYERIGTFSSDITNEIIDGYILKKEDGTELTTIFICPYVNANPQRAPKGFILD